MSYAAWEIWLYGSQARGDADVRSDVDVLLAGDVPSERVATYQARFGHRLAPSAYTFDELRNMRAYGSLFLLHLAKEGHVLEAAPGARRLSTLLQNLPPYRHFRRDLASFQATLADVRDSLRGDCSPPFELAVVATVVRHASVLGCYLTQRPTFGRSAPVVAFCGAVGVPDETRDELLALYEHRMAAVRAGTGLDTDKRKIERAVDIVDAYLDLVEEAADAHNGAVRVADQIGG